MLLTDRVGAMVIVEPTYKQGWKIPGGAVEDGESPRAGAVREVAEELGIARTPGALLVVDHVPANPRPRCPARAAGGAVEVRQGAQGHDVTPPGIAGPGRPAFGMSAPGAVLSFRAGRRRAR